MSLASAREASSTRRRRAVFSRARLQLTAWYALTLALIVLVFSGILYGIFAARLHGYRHEQESPAERRVEHETATFAVGELRVYLLLGNVALLLLGIGGAYLLAGRTLQPIAEAMERQDRFTADASHELRTPLTAIRSAVDVALQRTRSPAAYHAVLVEVNEEAEAMTVLLDQLLWLARGAPPLRPEPVELRALLDDVARRRAELAAERGSSVEVRAGPAITLQADPAALRLVLLNLVSNAIEHTPRGTKVWIVAEPEGQGVVLQVSDNGPGIPEAERASVFRPFYRLGATGSQDRGLGLTLTQELVAAAGGTIRIAETPGGGMTVYVSLPQADSTGAMGRERLPPLH